MLSANIGKARNKLASKARLREETSDYDAYFLTMDNIQQNQLEIILKKLDDLAQKQTSDSENIQTQLQAITDRQNTEAKDSRVTMQLFQSRLDSFYEQMSARVASESVLGHGNALPITGIGPRLNTEVRDLNSNAPASSRQVTPHSYIPRVDFPRFEGTNAHSWLLSCEAYFRVVPEVPGVQRPYLAGMHFDGEAKTWFQTFVV